MINGAFMLIVVVLSGGLCGSLIIWGIALIKEGIKYLLEYDFLYFSVFMVTAFVTFFAGLGMFYVTTKAMEYI